MGRRLLLTAAFAVLRIACPNFHANLIFLRKRGVDRRERGLEIPVDIASKRFQGRYIDRADGIGQTVAGGEGAQVREHGQKSGKSFTASGRSQESGYSVLATSAEAHELGYRSGEEIWPETIVLRPDTTGPGAQGP